MENLTGHSLKGYELLERIGSGGFGAVYRAYQSTVGREVAVKVILPHFDNQPDFIRRFEAEAQLIARLEHLHIVPLYDYWREPDGAYLVMRWLRGGSLKDALSDGPFDLEPAAHLLDQVAAALTNRQIAQELTIAHSTVKWYIRQIYGKLGVRGRRQAITRFKEMEAATSPPAEAKTETDHDVSLPPPVNPYKGLRPFAAADRDDFYGREALVDRLLEWLRLSDGERPSESSIGSGRFLAVVGPSGSGKSSLVHAGLIPALWNGRLPGSDRWFVVDFTPGARPLDELEVALIRVAADQAGNLRRQLERDANGLLRAAGLILPQDDSELVLAIDQFEELFNLVEDEAERTHFLELLTTAVTDPHSRVRVVLTLRADYYDRPLHYPDFGRLVRGQMETVLPLKAGELKQAIVRPAVAAGVTFEPGLVAASGLNRETDPELSTLLALAAIEENETAEAVNALHGAVQASRLERTLYGHSRFAFWLQVGRDGRTLASSALNGSRVWDLSSGERRFSLPGYDVGFGEDGRLLTFQRDEENRRLLIHTWAADGAPIEGDISDIAVEGEGFWRYMFNPEPARLAIVHEDGRVQLWDAAAGEQIRDWMPHPRPLSDILYSPDGALMVTVAGDATIWDGETGEALLTLPANASDVAHRRSLAFSPDGSLLAGNAADAPGDVVLWDVPASLAAGEGRRRMTLPGHTNLINAFAFNGDGTLLATASQDRTARVWTLTENDGRSLYTLAGHETGVMNVTFAQNGERLVTGDQAGLIRVWNITPGGGRELFTRQYPGALFRLDYSPANEQFATTSLDGQVGIWNGDGGEALRTWPAHEGQAYDVAYSPDGRFLATSGSDNQTVVWDAAGGERQFAVAGHGEGAAADVFPNFQAVAFSPDGRRLATGGVDGQVKVWDATTGDPVALPNEISITNDGEPMPIINLAYSPDGRYLLVSGDGDEATLFDAAGEELLAFPAAFRGSLAFSPDGSLLVSGSLDGDARVWAVEGGEPRFTLSGSGAGVADLRLADGGQTILTIGLDGSIRAYLAETADLATLAQSRLTRWWRPDERRRYLRQPDCPDPPETMAVMETATEPAQFSGVWQALGPTPFPYLAFREDNTLVMADSLTSLDTSSPVTMTFEMDAGTLLVANERCGEAVGAYTVRLLHDPTREPRIILSMGSDPCGPRRGILAQEFVRVEG